MPQQPHPLIISSPQRAAPTPPRAMPRAPPTPPPEAYMGDNASVSSPGGTLDAIPRQRGNCGRDSLSSATSTTESSVTASSISSVTTKGPRMKHRTLPSPSDFCHPASPCDPPPSYRRPFPQVSAYGAAVSTMRAIRFPGSAASLPLRSLAPTPVTPLNKEEIYWAVIMGAHPGVYLGR